MSTRAVAATEIKVGDRFICKVSTFEANMIPGQAPGSIYYLRVTNISKSRWYLHYSVAMENADRVAIGRSLTTSRRKDTQAIIAA